MKRPKFTLRSLFIMLTLAAALLGYTQWRRQRILREARELESLGFTLLRQDTWTDWIWPVVPKEAKCEYYQLPGGKWQIGSDVYRAEQEEEINAHYARACDRLYALGVANVRLDREGKPGNTGTSTCRGK
jgi:hypothetical protein